MTPAARVQSAIDLLDAIILAAKEGGAAADTIATRFFKERRYAGSGDRRAIRELVWRAIRRFGKAPDTARSAFVALADEDEALADLFTGEERAPYAIKHDEPRATGGVMPKWLLPLLDARIGGKGGNAAEIEALLSRAPLDLRINRARAEGTEFPAGDPLPAPLDGLRLAGDTPVLDSAAWLYGAIEVQDAGSQLISWACAAKPGMTVIDLCAGAGGKTLALAAQMDLATGSESGGRLIACDTDRRRIQQLPPRADRAGAEGIETRLLNPGEEAAALADLAGRADVVLVDAPCSGSGTWRRNPEARWRLTHARLARLQAEQARLLDIAAPLVAKGGSLVYAVCAITRSEGEEQVSAFMARQKGWSIDDPFPGSPAARLGRAAGVGRLLTPHHDSTDGFFLVRLRAG